MGGKHKLHWQEGVALAPSKVERLWQVGTWPYTLLHGEGVSTAGWAEGLALCYWKTRQLRSGFQERIVLGAHSGPRRGLVT